MQYARREQDASITLPAGARAPFARRIDCAEAEAPRREPPPATPRTGRRAADDWTRARRSTG